MVVLISVELAVLKHFNRKRRSIFIIIIGHSARKCMIRLLNNGFNRKIQLELFFFP